MFGPRVNSTLLRGLANGLEPRAPYLGPKGTTMPPTPHALEGEPILLAGQVDAKLGKPTLLEEPAQLSCPPH